MATKVSSLTALLGADVTTSDLLYIVDVTAGTSGGKKITTGELNSALDAQNHAFTGTQTTTRGVASGTALKIGGSAFAQVTASTAITGASENETMFDQSYTLPANTLGQGTRVRIRAQGIHTATTSSETHTMTLKVGSVSLVSQASIDPANNDLFYFDFEFVCRTTGGSGTIVGCGVAAFGASATANPTVRYLASTTIDTTAANIIGVYIDRQSSATDSDSARLDFLTVDVLG
jgi:hypothetical protein